MNSTKEFIQIANVRMIWDIISDEELFRFLPQEMQVKVYELFQSNLQGFYETEKVRCSSLVDLNKKYILLVLRYIKNQIQVLPSKIRIHNEEQEKQPQKELVTFEEIKKVKQTQFDVDLMRRQAEFEEYVTVKQPEVPAFADQAKDQPIQEMDKILKQMQMQRNYEIEQIRTNTTLPAEGTNNWLTPQETSIKSPQKKNVSFEIDRNVEERPRNMEERPRNVEERPRNVEEQPIKILIEEEDTMDNILFTKLKKVPSTDNNSRLSALEKQVTEIHQKLDKILSLVNPK